MRSPLDNKEEARKELKDELGPSSVDEDSLKRENEKLKDKLEFAVNEIDSYWDRIQTLESEKAELESQRDVLKETLKDQTNFSQEKLLSSIYVASSIGVVLVGISVSNIAVVVIGGFSLLGTLGHALDVKKR